MAEKLLIINGGRLGGGSSTPQVNEKVEIPPLPEFERTYAPDAEAGPEEIVIPRFEKEPKSVLSTIPGSSTDPEAAKSKLEEEWGQQRAEMDAQDEALRKGGFA